MKTFYTVNRELAAEEKQPPQAKAIIAAIVGKVGVGNPLDRKDLIAELTASGVLNTRQDVGRVVAFYQPRLTESGILGVTKESEAADEEAAEAKAKTRAPRVKSKGKASAGNEDAAAA
jgi:hypothetical protein